MEKMKHFNFDDWRRRYMRWMNHNKARVMDFFRRQDKDHDGKVTRDEFVQGIIASSKLSDFVEVVWYDVDGSKASYRWVIARKT